MKALFHFPHIPYCPSILYHAFLLFNWEKKEVIEQLPLKHWTISPRNTEKSTSLKNLLICWISIPKQLKYLSFTVKKKKSKCFRVFMQTSTCCNIQQKLANLMAKSFLKKKTPPSPPKKVFINLSCQKCTFKLLSIMDSTLIHPLDVTSGKVNSMLSHSGEQPPHHQR